MQRINLNALGGQVQMEKRLSVKSSLAQSPSKISPDKARSRMLANQDSLNTSVSASPQKALKATPARLSSDQKNRSLFKRGRGLARLTTDEYKEQLDLI